MLHWTLVFWLSHDRGGFGPFRYCRAAASIAKVLSLFSGSFVISLGV